MDSMQGTLLSNRYLIAEEIGIGGMGNVYRATDLRTGGAVAVKIPHAFLARNPEYMERLRREAQIAASVYSPRVVRVIDLDVHEGAPYLVMEYVPGETLAETLRRQGRFSLLDTLNLGLEVARALDAAHAKGIVHRDLKPQNIKLVDGEVKVLDFGIAKAEGFANVTAASVFMGTPEYCAPERAEGEGDIRSDIYSLGIIMFEMHAGRLPFQAATPLALMRKHESEPPPPLGGDTPAAVEAIIARCLAKRPEQRYQTPRELVQALREALDAPVGTAHTPTPDGVALTIRQARDTETALTSPTIPMGNGATLSGTAVATRPGAATPATGTGSTAIPVAVPRRPGTMLLAGSIFLVLALGAAVVLLIATRDGGDGAPTPAPTDPSRIAGASATPVPTPSPPRLLLPVGERISLAGSQPIELPVPICPGVKIVLRLTSMLAEPDGRVTIGFTFEMPRVAGVECPNLAYDRDDNCCSALITRRATGPPVQARVNGGSGLAVSGAEDVYGQPERSGTWVYPDVELDGEDLTLVRYARNEQDPFAGTILFQVLLGRR
jgi:serine/threonine-protein kinase